MALLVLAKEIRCHEGYSIRWNGKRNFVTKQKKCGSYICVNTAIISTYSDIEATPSFGQV